MVSRARPEGNGLSGTLSWCGGRSLSLPPIAGSGRCCGMRQGAMPARLLLVAQAVFDENTGRQIEVLYQAGDAVRRRRLVRVALGAGPGDAILDVGCGPGFYCSELAEEVGPGGTVVGIDSAPAMLELAVRRCERQPNVTFRQGGATSLPVQDAAFDGAICVQVLEYVEDVPAALAELHRALRPGGRLVVWDIDWATVSWHSEDPARMARVLNAWDEHLTNRSLPRLLAPAMTKAGFEPVTMEAHSFATNEFDPDAYGVGAIPLVRSFVPGHQGVTNEEAEAWASEQRDLGQRKEFYFACLQFCFTATRPT
jgi:arsenite methyltransferase